MAAYTWRGSGLLIVTVSTSTPVSSCECDVFVSVVEVVGGSMSVPDGEVSSRCESVAESACN